jgi:DNA (cytosine-5)-methyltransferase 1
MKFKLGEFFCGPGGIALGAINTEAISNHKGEEYSVSPTWATDYDADTCKTYALNIHGDEDYPSKKVFCNDIRKLNIKNFDACDGFAFGFPCNDFSLVGETKGINGHFGPLYTYGVEYLRVHQPMWFVAENVGGLSSANEGKAFRNILNELAEVGYILTPHLYRFEEYGLPQARHRIIIVGLRNNINLKFRVPSPFRINKLKSAREAIMEPPIPMDAPNQELTRQSKTVIERLEHISPGKNAWNSDLPEHLQLNVKGAKLSNIYKRLDPNKPAYTVTGSGGGGTHMYHWSENRALTNRERARLQTFPDDYFFVGTKESVRKQIGMAVPPKGASIIFKAILETFAKVEYEPIDPNINILID